MKFNKSIVFGLVLAVMVCKTSSMSHAQTQLPEYTLKLTPTEVDQLGNAIGNLPYKDAVPLMNKLRSQVVEQQQAVEKAKIEAEKAKEPPKVETPKAD